VSFAVGTLVKARGREWVVLPESADDLLMLRPLGGTDAEVTGIYMPLEPVEPARFELPDPGQVGDHRSARMLRDAVMLAVRASTGPFRSFGRINVEPRPYQLVPLLMALKLDPVRMLIADDVGVGKTIEACLVARELLDRGEITRLAVVCPPHLAEQWQAELSDKFHIQAELVLRSTARKLERGIKVGESLFDIYPHVVVSLDFIKSEQRCDDFARACPEFVIIDEAHTCAFGYEGRGGRHQRHRLVKRLAADEGRHLVLVTATPHSGKEEAFRSLLSLLKPDFSDLPEDLTGSSNEAQRRNLAAHFIQRRRGDIRHFLKAETPFPFREEAEATYRFSPEYRRFFDRVIKFTRETVADTSGGRHRQRVRWWSALSLLRSVGSSPAAAAATLRNRTPVAEAETVEQVDDIGQRTVLDVDVDDEARVEEVAPGADTGEDDRDAGPRRRLLELAREAEKLKGDKDAKLLKAVRLVKELLDDGYHPIVFCRFIPTAEYVAEELRSRLPKGIEVTSVTGLMAPADREARVRELADAPKRVLVCTDCLSEGINLQDRFDAAMHYDLLWNPTRHEQREGRVDRFGQKRTKVRVLTYYGSDNPIDGMVLDVLIRKHRKIRTSLGISVPVPLDTDTVVEAIFEGLLLRSGSGKGEQVLIPGIEKYVKPKKEHLHTIWDGVAEREKRSRTVFAQESIKVDEVARELEETRRAVGSEKDVERFTVEALRAHRAVIAQKNGVTHFSLRETPRALRDLLPGDHTDFDASFGLPVGEGVVYLGRTHPIVNALSSYVMDTALDPQLEGIAKRAGAIRTRDVEKRTTLLLVRYRYDIVTGGRSAESAQLAEECRMLAFAGAPGSAKWLDTYACEALLEAEPSANVSAAQAESFVRVVIEGMEALTLNIEEEARRRAEALCDAHRRVRKAARVRGESCVVEPKLPADVLGIYVYLPHA